MSNLAKACIVMQRFRPRCRTEIKQSCGLLFSLLLTLAMLSSSPQAYGAESQSVLVEPTGYLFSDAPVAEIRALPQSRFTPYSASEHLGFVDKPVWLSVDIPKTMQNTPLFLSVKYALIDEIEAYRAQDLSLIYRGGDTLTSPPSIDLFGYAIPLENTIHGERVLLKLVSHNALQLDISVQSVFDIADSNTALWVFYFAATAALIVCAAWAARDLWRNYDVLVFWFLIRVVSLLLVLPLHIGVLRAWLTTDAIPPLDLLQDLSTLVYISIAQIFDYVLIRKVVGRRSARSLAIAIVGFSAIKVLLVAVNQIAWALAVNQTSVIVCIIIGVGILIVKRSLISTAFYKGVAAYFLLQSLIVAALFVSIGFAIPLTPLMLALSLILQGIFSMGFVVVVLLRERRRARAENRRLESIAREQRLLAELEASKRRESSELMRMLSHEINNPLTMLQLASTSEQLSKTRLSNAIQSISHIIQQCELADELQQGTPFSRRATFNVREFVQEICESYGIELIQHGPNHSTIPVLCSREALQIVLVNLLNNADKYRVADTAISVELCMNGSGNSSPLSVQLRVRNKCAETFEHDIQQLTEKYTRGRASSPISGTGLGLYIAKTLCARTGVGFEICLEDGYFEARLEFEQHIEVSTTDVSCALPSPTTPDNDLHQEPRWTSP